MNLPLAWDNVVAYSLQIGLLVGLAASFPRVLRLRQPGELLFWQAAAGCVPGAASGAAVETGNRDRAGRFRRHRFR